MKSVFFYLYPILNRLFKVIFTPLPAEKTTLKKTNLTKVKHLFSRSFLISSNYLQKTFTIQSIEKLEECNSLFSLNFPLCKLDRETN